MTAISAKVCDASGCGWSAKKTPQVCDSCTTKADALSCLESGCGVMPDMRCMVAAVVGVHEDPAHDDKRSKQGKEARSMAWLAHRRSVWTRGASGAAWGE